jgi:hypothetical protein
MLSYTREISCQAENTLTIDLILRAFRGFLVDKSVEILWIKMWIIRQAFMRQKLKVFDQVLRSGRTCGKEKFTPRKKIFEGRK